MDYNDEGASFALNIGDSAGSHDAPSAVNSSVLNYYKKFGRKRDLEQFFSLSTAQSEIRDPRSSFWRRMKAPSDSSDSGDNRGKSESSLEVCRISIKCTVPEEEPGRSQDPDNNVLDKSESVSPPIVTEDAAVDTSQHTEDECVKSDGEHSQKSNDATLDTSINKPFSPTSSITSQRKLEWDSLADVGYANDGDRKNSASSLSTLERLALKQQYSNNDTQPDNSKLGTPTAHSTPQEETDMKFKGKKAKTTKFHSRDVDLVEVNMPESTQINPPQAISVNLTKHISFNVEKDGGVTLHNINRNLSMKPEKVTVETEMTPQVKIDKEIQTSLKKTKDKSSSSGEMAKNVHLYGHGVPVLINLNAVRKKTRKKKLRTARRKLQCKRNMNANKENLPVLEKSGEQVSEAESFEYMPGHIYNQNQLNNDQPTHNSIPDNKSSLESSGALTTTDSSKASKHSFTKDLEKSINLLKTALQSRYDDTSLKQRLIKEVVERLIKSNYRGDKTTTDFLSGLSFSSKNLGLGESNQTTTSTSDANNTADKPKLTKPKKSILRSDKFNSNPMRSTSQSAPNLPCASKSDLPITSSFRNPIISSTNTESDVSSKDKLSSDPAVAKTSSEELYNKYLNALKKEQAYKKHLREKEMFLKQKLGSSESALKFPVSLNSSTQNRVKDLIKDLTRNNYDDGSGDASKLEVVSSSYNINPQRYSAKPQRSHSVFTLSSGGSSCQYNKLNPRKDETKKSPRATHSKNEHYCCCPYHSGNTRMGVTDSSVQVDLNPKYNGSAVNPTCGCHKIAPPTATGDVKYMCFCTDKSLIDKNGDKIIVYKCPFQPSKVQLQDSNECMYGNKPSKSSQTNLPLNLLGSKYSDQSSTISSEDKHRMNICLARESDKKYVFVHEGIRCTQTEISINPKISDPHLSDIEIVCNCAELIGEQFREVSKSSIQSESVCVGEQNADISSPKDDVTNLPKEDKYVQSVLGEYQERDIHPQISVPAGLQDNYRIPIQGTNMTLMVSIDSKSDNDPLQKVLNIGELRIAADTVGPMGFAPCSQNSVLCNFAPKTQVLSETFPNNTYPSNKPSPILTPIYSTGSLHHYDPKNDIGEERLLANYEYPKMERKCPCPETATCGRTCTDSAECVNPKTECLESPKLVEKLLPKYSMEKVKCIGPESAKCGGDCGPGAPCMKPKPKPLLRANTDSGIMPKANFNIDSPKKPESARGFGASAPNFNSKCKCGASAKFGGTCGPDAPCMKDKPRDFDPRGFGASAPNFNATKCKCGASAKCGGTCGPDAPCMKDKPRDLDPRGFGASAPNFNSFKCKCGASAKCGGTCGSDAPCMKAKPRDLDHGFGACAPNFNATKCKCGASAKCGGTCGPDAPCMTDKPRDIDPPKQPRPLGLNEPDATKPKCACPPSANCGQTCDENAPCMKTKALPLGAMKPCTKNEPPRSIASDTDKSDCTSKAILNKRECVCPLSAKCGQTCDENAPCLKGKSRTSNPNDTDKSEFACKSTLNTRKCACPPSAKCGQTCNENAPCMKKSQVLPSNTEKSECAPKQLNTPKCVCPPSAGCGQTCDENAPCMNTNKPDPIDNCTSEHSKVKLSPKKTMLRYNMNPDDWRDDFVQTEPLGKSQSSTQTDKSDSSNSAKPRRAESVRPSRNERAPRSGATKDLVLDMIQDITKRYSKKDIEKNQRKKCFKEIMTVLNYLLDIDDNPNPDSGDSDRLPECCDDSTKLPEYCEDNNKLPECCEKKESKKNETFDCVQKADECCGTEDIPVRNVRMAVESSTDESCTCGSNIQIKDCRCKAIYLNKKMQSCIKHCRSTIVCPPSPCVFPLSTDNPCSTSSDTTTCRVLNRIRKECDKYHQKRCCSSHGGKGMCETSSTTSVSCLNCKRTHHCYCKGNRCRGYRSKTCADKLRKKCIAYNLIIQTSESMVSEDAPCDQKCRPLKNIFVKVPPKHKVCDMPFKEACTKVEEEQPSCSPCCKGRCRKSRSASVGSCTDEAHKTTQVYSVREYLERNRPDFVEQCSKRQHCLKSINENSCQASCGPSRLQMVVVHPPNPCVDPCNTYCGGGATTMTCNPAEFCNFPSQYKYEARRIAMRRSVSRDLLSLQLQMQMGDPIALSDLSERDLQEFAKQLGVDIKRKRLTPKFINERDMKKHSEKIYKSLPEVQRKKEEARKERIKKTNLIMANLFKKNLQKKTLSGAVNISNYSTVVKI